LSLFGLLLLALGASWIAHGSVTSGGWESAVLQALVWLEIAFMGVLLLCMDLGELVSRLLRRQAAEPERVGERRAKTPWRAGQR
jgi:hypothetical protein